MYLENFTPPSYLSSSSPSYPLFQTVLGEFLYAIFLCIYVEYFYTLTLSSLSFSSSSCWPPSKTIPMYIHLIITIIILDLGSIWTFELGLCHLAWWSPVSSTSSKLCHFTFHNICIYIPYFLHQFLGTSAVSTVFLLWREIQYISVCTMSFLYWFQGSYFKMQFATYIDKFPGPST
jgi:hypothetical protein